MINGIGRVDNQVSEAYKTTGPISIISTRQFEALFLASSLKNSCIDEHFQHKSSVDNAVSHAGIFINKPVENPEHIDSFSATSPIQAQALSNTNLSPTESFIQSIWPYASKAASILNIDPKMLLAQAVLETGWGLHITKNAEGSSNNIFNIKSTKLDTQDSLSVKALEYSNNSPVLLQENFRKYSSIEASFNDYVSLITENSRYQKALEQSENPEKFIQAIQEAGYATDPQYSNKILSIYHSKALAEVIQRCGIVAECLGNNA